MIYVIKPSGRGFKGVIDFYLRSLLYAIGSILGSGLTGATVAFLGSMIVSGNNLFLLIIIILTVLYAASEFKLPFLKMPMPQIKWQVPVSWIEKNEIFGSLAYGFTIGLSFLTFITFPGFYVMLLLLAYIGNVNFGFIVGGIYGLFRAIVLLTSSYSIHKTMASVSRFSSLVFSKVRLWHKVSGTVLLAVSILLLIKFI